MADNSNSDKETISRLREALANMNKDYMQTKLELDQMRGTQQQQQQQQKASNDAKSDLGAQFALRFSSKVKALQSNINTKLATAGIQLNNEIAATATENNSSGDQHTDNHNNESAADNEKSLESRRLRDDLESMETQMNNLRTMLRQSMEEKEQLQKERNELLIKYGEADEQIKRLKEQSNVDANRYEELLDSFRAENSSQIETEKKKLYKEFDDKLNELSKQYTEYKTKYEQVKAEWDDNEERWNNRFDLVVSERNSLKRKVKSLQNDLSELMRNNQHGHTITNSSVSPQLEEVEEVKVEHQQKSMEIERLKTEIAELKKSHNNEKTALLTNMQRLSSKTAVQSKTGDMQFLVNSLSNLISEKEDIIQSLTQSRRYLGHTLLKKEDEIVNLKKQLLLLQNNGKKK
eukprot:CAMPEP_0197022972 /NCGR_PEP_ID=MMETSP1384-20130603/3765_1 /TAXON_ID=29189 /ORGANISM="Ammonia sp." /LENGTH=405 /DNA_ID=CAMNT_0042451105 /DNA_START=34 /DNA_END=1251 /DNA_ORIENTATION=-